ncbi:2-amino-4-hydroxy-6-hydroxymethyldihydropteridinediphosphokinase [Kaistia soli DSM 19436]|uniref:2-amino-4-hydroxy-6-hydroxymethyldihydropteridine pyrophosphokinase n=1 Tax=Kaistia soli DSM 19436 TaxID=1122133 RepID=A0A1M5H2V3_9HYPH|nr:2-amino-4-hydroxy-6-hydroxymethyldihydropteridine diphosphokinase [Kaistia soli]SHG10216.1 2-amino-4-hydroxy-6-hydroxymethyldihydropteridinediphosphokinase [Kaistia soli DSM 19436]
MPEAFLGLGSNLGDRHALLQAAVDALAAADGVIVRAASPIYETPPWGPVPQGPYLNACVAVETSLPARALLDLGLSIEREHGRERAVRWGPRTLDIDLLAYGAAAIDEPGLVVPHPRMTERAFVLVPLADIAPELAFAGKPIGAWLGLLDTSTIVPRHDLPPLVA